MAELRSGRPDRSLPYRSQVRVTMSQPIRARCRASDGLQSHAVAPVRRCHDALSPGLHLQAHSTRLRFVRRAGGYLQISMLIDEPLPARATSDGSPTISTLAPEPGMPDRSESDRSRPAAT